MWEEICDWVDAARVAAGMRNNRVGILGHYYCGMLDVYSDLTQQSVAFGNHFEIVEMCELADFRKAVRPDEISQKVAEFNDKFDVARECEEAEIERAARTSIKKSKASRK